MVDHREIEYLVIFQNYYTTTMVKTTRQSTINRQLEISRNIITMYVSLVGVFVSLEV